MILLLGQEEARDMHPGEQISGSVGDVMPRADPCSVFDPEASEARYDPCLPLKSFQTEGHWGKEQVVLADRSSFLQ